MAPKIIGQIQDKIAKPRMKITLKVIAIRALLSIVKLAQMDLNIMRIDSLHQRFLQ
jgi:hypothetical protein